jgi:hypothetical protein
MRLASFAACALVVLGADAAVPGGPDPFDGKWQMDLQRSQLDPLDSRVRMVIAIQTQGMSVHYESESTYRNGRVVHVHYAADYDGSPALVLGDHGLMLPVSIARIDDHTMEVSYMRGLRVIAKSRNVVSPGGAVLTITTTSAAPNGQPVRTVNVFSKLR